MTRYRARLERALKRHGRQDTELWEPMPLEPNLFTSEQVPDLRLTLEQLDARATLRPGLRVVTFEDAEP